MKTSHSMSRRRFMKQGMFALGMAGSSRLLPASAPGPAGRAAAGERIAMGIVGLGGRGVRVARSFLREPDVQVVAVCDVDRESLERGRSIVDRYYGNHDCAALRDFRELLARADIDAVVVATPDYRHAAVAIAAAGAGKDVYCERPLSSSVAEGRAICEAVRRHNRVLQTGSHERSESRVRFACELIRSGRIGRLHTMRMNLPGKDGRRLQIRRTTRVDGDRRPGPAPAASFTSRGGQYGGPSMPAYGECVPVIDIGQLGAGTDGTGPVEFHAVGVRFVNTYANGLKMIGEARGPRGIRFEGSEGWIFVPADGAHLDGRPASLLEDGPGTLRVQLGRTESHFRNFLECVRSRNQPFAPAEAGQRTATICLLNDLAMQLGRILRWDPEEERVLDDEEANRLL